MTGRQIPLPSRRDALFALAGSLPFALAAQTGGFPQKPVRIVVPYPTGGSNDVIARLLAQQLQEQWGQAVVVDNKPGAAGNIGASEVAKAAPDGHTLLLTNINITSMNPALIANMPFDPQKDFAPISLLGTTTLALVVHPSVPANTVIDLVNLAQKEPGRLNYASSGNGSPQHMSAEMFKAMTRTQITHVPYRGAAPAVNDLLAGQVQVSVGVVNQLIPHIRSGRVRALGVTSRKRLAQRNLAGPGRASGHASGPDRAAQSGRAQGLVQPRDCHPTAGAGHRCAAEHASADASACPGRPQALGRDHPKRRH